MEKTVCSTPGCTTEGGQFHFRGGRWICDHCLRAPRLRDGTHKNWPIVTTNVRDPNEGPLVIHNLRELRQYENRYGVASEPYNQNHVAEYRRD